MSRWPNLALTLRSRAIVEQRHAVRTFEREFTRVASEALRMASEIATKDIFEKRGMLS